jgi:hypothetical protein
MKAKIKFITLGIFSLLIGSAFATPLLISELNIVPFWTIPEGPKTDLSINVVYANFTIQNDLPRYNVNIGEYYESNLEYTLVLNITNLYKVPTKVSNIGLACAKNTTVIPTALGGFFATHQDGMKHSGGSFISTGPVEGYLGHVGGGRVEGLWLDGKWINITWVPEGGLAEIWQSENIFPPKALEGVWENNWYPYEAINFYNDIASKYPDQDMPPYVPFGGDRSNDTGDYYTWTGIVFTLQGGNYWIEGIPLKEYIADGEVKATVIYHNGSWIDVTDRIRLEDRPFVFANDLLMQVQTHFQRYNLKSEEESSFPVGSYVDSSSVGGFNLKFIYDFDNTWESNQSRLIQLSGSMDIGNSWKPDELLKDNDITIYMELVNYVPENIVNGVEVNTVSTSTGLMTIQLERNGGSYLYNVILLDNQTSITDLPEVESFVLRNAEQ